MKTLTLRIRILWATLIIALMPLSTVLATPDYARQTGYECGKCHIDVIGGGKLTPTGEAFLESMKAKGQYRQLRQCSTSSGS